MKIKLFSLLLFMLMATTGCRINPTKTVEPNTASTMTLTSSAFTEGGRIPAVYSCQDGKSPALAWTEPPTGTKSFAIIMDDPDAPHGTFLHWIIFNIPATSRGLPEAVARFASLTDGSLQDKNGLGTVGYVGPCPPKGLHHYSFRLYALDVQFEAAVDKPKDDRLAEIKAHTLAQAELIGTFTK